MNIARNSDPVTSHIAASEITEDGTRACMQAKTLALLKAHQGSTANELEAIGGFKDGQIRKRLHDLFQLDEVAQGPVRPSRVTGKPNITWYTVDAAPKEAVRITDAPRTKTPDTKARLDRATKIIKLASLLIQPGDEGAQLTGHSNFRNTLMRHVRHYMAEEPTK